MVEVAGWGEWLEREGPAEGHTRRSQREENYLWAMLRVLDKQSAGEEKRLKVKQKKVVAKARKRMGVGQDQPSILDTLRRQATGRGRGVLKLAGPVSSPEGRGRCERAHCLREEYCSES